MSPQDVLDRLRKDRMLPLERFDSATDALPLAEARRREGLSCMAVTVRSAACFEGLSKVREKFPDMVLGAADIRDPALIRRAADVGVDFVIMPVTRSDLIEACKKAEVLPVPGCCTPTEIDLALSCGSILLNFFPAEAVGGLKALTGISGPFDDAEFLVLNGVEPENIKTYLGFRKVVACGIKWSVRT